LALVPSQSRSRPPRWSLRNSESLSLLRSFTFFPATHFPDPDPAGAFLRTIHSEGSAGPNPTTKAAAELQRGSYHQRSHFQRPPCPRGSPVPRLSPAEASTALRNSERFYPRDAWLSLLDLKGRPSALWSSCCASRPQGLCWWWGWGNDCVTSFTERANQRNHLTLSMSLFDAAILQDFDVALRSTSKLSDQAHGKRAPVVGDKHVGSWQGVRWFDSGKLRPPHGATNFRTLCRGHGATQAAAFFERLVLKI